MREEYEFGDGIKAIVDMGALTVSIQERGEDVRVFRGFKFSDEIDSFLMFGDFGSLACNEFESATLPAFKLECEELRR